MAAGEPRMTTAEVIEEVEWLLSFDVSPLLIPSLVGRTITGLEKLLRVAGRKDLAAVFWRDVPNRPLTPAQQARKSERRRERRSKQAA